MSDYCEVLIEYPVKTRDPANYNTEVISAWEPLDVEPGSPPVGIRSWAEVQDLLPSRAENLAAGVLIAANRTRVRMRWRDDITSEMRITIFRDSAIVYQIIGGPANVGERKQKIEMLCEEYSA